MSKNKRRIAAILAIALACTIPWWVDAIDSDGRTEPGSMATTPSSKRQCTPEEPCTPPPPRKLARKFRHDRLRHFSRRVPKPIRRKLNRKYGKQISKGSIDDWWNQPCDNTGWVCGGRYCQVTDQFASTRHCKDPGWYHQGGAADIDWGEVTKVSVICGTAAAGGAVGGRIESGRFGWWGAGIAGGTCLWREIGERNDWWPFDKSEPVSKKVTTEATVASDSGQQ